MTAATLNVAPPHAADRFTDRRAVFEVELDALYRTYPVDVSDVVTKLDQVRAERPGLTAYTEKALVYEIAAECCDVHVFRYCPFYFEIRSGRARHRWGFDGIGGWFRDRHLREFSHEIDEIRRLYTGFFSFNSNTATIMDEDHHSVGYDNVLAKGLNGIRQEAEALAVAANGVRKTAFYGSVMTGCDALIRISRKFSEKARGLLATEADPVARRNLTRIADSAAVVPAQPPRTFYEALNALIFMREMMGSLEGIGVSTFGHMDRMLLPFYKRDLATGQITPEEAKDLLSAFLLYTEIRFECRKARHETSTTVVLGGCDADGNVVCNDITHMVLDIHRELRLIEPKLHVRLSARHPHELLEWCADLVARRRNVMAMFNDDVVVAANVKAGKAVRDARLYVAGGCQENKLQNCEINSRATLYMNVPKLLEVGFFPERVGELASEEGLALEGFDDCRDFEALYQVVLRNAHELARGLAQKRSRQEARSVEINPCPLLSATLDDCLVKGLDMAEGGARYSVASIGMTGLGTLVDSLIAVQSLVYDDATLGIKEFGDVLAANYEGHESLRQCVLHKLPKHGSGHPAVEELSRRAFADMARAVSGFPNGRGGTYEASLFSHLSYMRFGQELMATPDGRHQGEHLSKGLGPSFISLGQSWPLGQVLDVLQAIDLTDYPVIGILDLKIPPVPVDGGGALIVPVIRRFLENGGSVLQINCVDTEDLRKAQEAPEQYNDLIVRVSGFSANFVTLSRDIQDEIINRSECQAFQ